MEADITRFASMLMFSPDLSECVVIRKNRPKFLAGKLCPVGGHVEPGEESADAAVREFLEEAGVATAAGDWKLYAVANGEDWTMDCYWTVSPNYAKATTLTEEEILVVRVADLLVAAATAPDTVAPDMIALVGLALQSRTRDCVARIEHAPASQKRAPAP
jgi:8-oxo-dGTP pyrophosphatase MutT (NUDIX family)